MVKFRKKPQLENLEIDPNFSWGNFGNFTATHKFYERRPDKFGNNFEISSSGVWCHTGSSSTFWMRHQWHLSRHDFNPHIGSSHFAGSLANCPADVSRHLQQTIFTGFIFQNNSHRNNLWNFQNVSCSLDKSPNPEAFGPKMPNQQIFTNGNQIAKIVHTNCSHQPAEKMRNVNQRAALKVMADFFCLFYDYLDLIIIIIIFLREVCHKWKFQQTHLSVWDEVKKSESGQRHSVHPLPSRDRDPSMQTHSFSAPSLPNIIGNWCTNKRAITKPRAVSRVSGFLGGDFIFCHKQLTFHSGSETEQNFPVGKRSNREKEPWCPHFSPSCLCLDSCPFPVSAFILHSRHSHPKMPSGQMYPLTLQIWLPNHAVRWGHLTLQFPRLQCILEGEQSSRWHRNQSCWPLPHPA